MGGFGVLQTGTVSARGEKFLGRFFHVCTYLHSLVPCAAGYFLNFLI